MAARGRRKPNMIFCASALFPALKSVLKISFGERAVLPQKMFSINSASNAAASARYEIVRRFVPFCFMVSSAYMCQKFQFIFVDRIRAFRREHAVHVQNQIGQLHAFLKQALRGTPDVAVLHGFEICQHGTF